MRHFVALCMLVCGSLAAPADESAEVAAALALKANALKCVQNSGLTTQQLQDCCAANPKEPEILAKHKKFTKCIQRTVGILQDDGTVHPERADILVRPTERARMLEIARNCLGGDTTDLDEKAHNVSVCYREADAKMYTANCNQFLDVVLA